MIWFQASLTASLHANIFIPQICSTSLILQAVLSHTFWLQKNTHSCEILLLKIQQVICLTFSRYSINILLNYLNFLNLAHFPISRNLFLVVWYSDSKTTEYSLLFVFLGKSSLFQDLQYWGSFLCVSLLLPIDNNSQTIAVISGIYLSVINWVLLLWVWKSTEYSVLFLYPWSILFSGLFR